MKNFQQHLATNPGPQARSSCYVCKNQIVDNKWFCRLPGKSEGVGGTQTAEILLCSPSCAFRYFANSENETITHH